LKVLQMNAVYGMGSTGKIVRDISDELIKQGHESYAMWAIDFRNRIDATEAELIRIGTLTDHKMHALLFRVDGGQGMHSKAATKRACKKILEISPDVVHLHNLHSNYIHLPTLFKFLAKHNIPTLLTLHDCWFLSGYCTHYKYQNDCQNWKNGCQNCVAVGNRLQKNVQKNLAVRRDLYAAMPRLTVNGVSKWTADAAKQSVLQSAERITHIYNWIDTEVFKPQGSAVETKKKYGISQNRKLILGVSQLWSANKGLDCFVALADRMRETADVILVGKSEGGPERENLHYIGFTSNIDELVRLYSAADVFVNPSNVETFGLVTVEAMACGTPVVAYDNSGSSEIVTEDCGALVKDGNTEELLARVSEFLRQGKECYSAACREYVCKHFEKNRQVKEYISLYQQISSSNEVYASRTQRTKSSDF